MRPGVVPVARRSPTLDAGALGLALIVLSATMLLVSIGLFGYAAIDQFDFTSHCEKLRDEPIYTDVKLNGEYYKACDW